MEPLLNAVGGRLLATAWELPVLVVILPGAGDTGLRVGCLRKGVGSGLGPAKPGLGLGGHTERCLVGRGLGRKELTTWLVVLDGAFACPPHPSGSRVQVQLEEGKTPAQSSGTPTPSGPSAQRPF